MQVSLKFTGNRAIIGSAVYANNLDLCSWYSYGTPYFYNNRSNVLRWPFVSYGYYIYNFRLLGINCFSLCRDEFALNINSGHSEENSSNQLLAVQTPATDFSVNTNNVSYI